MQLAAPTFQIDGKSVGPTCTIPDVRRLKMGTQRRQCPKGENTHLKGNQLLLILKILFI